MADPSFPALVSIKRARHELGGVAQSYIYTLVAHGHLKIVGVGRLKRITGVSLARVVKTGVPIIRKPKAA